MRIILSLTISAIILIASQHGHLSETKAMALSAVQLVESLPSVLNQALQAAQGR
jgi:hypothetical protein